MTEAPGAPPRRRGWVRTLAYVLVAVALAVLVRTFLVQIYVIPSGSMRPTLAEGDRLLATKLSGYPSRGDVVVFRLPGPEGEAGSSLPGPLRVVGEALGIAPARTDLVKRVVGLQGETIEVRSGELLVDGEPLREDYVAFGSRLEDFGPLAVPDDHVFLLGDNRNESRDSRAYGTVAADQIEGRALWIVWPPGRWGGL